MIRKYVSVEHEDLELEILDLLQDSNGNVKYLVRTFYRDRELDWEHDLVTVRELEHYWRPVK